LRSGASLTVGRLSADDDPSTIGCLACQDSVDYGRPDPSGELGQPRREGTVAKKKDKKDKKKKDKKKSKK
jgi:hypothetical protein